MQYPASFLMLCVGHLVVTAVDFVGIWALFDRFSMLKGWSLPEIALMYGLVNTGFGLSEVLGRGIKNVPHLIRSGDLDRLLTRPRSTVLQLVGYETEVFRVGRSLQGLAVLVWAVSEMPETITASNVILSVVIVAGGCLLFLGVFLIQATVAIWTVEALEAPNILSYGGVEAASYPLTIYKDWFRSLFTYVVPLAFVNYIPVTAMLGHPGSPSVGSLMILIPLVCIVFFWACTAFWRFGLRRYCSTGS